MAVTSSCSERNHIQLLGPSLCLTGHFCFVSPFVFFEETDAACVQLHRVLHRFFSGREQLHMASLKIVCYWEVFSFRVIGKFIYAGSGEKKWEN